MRTCIDCKNTFDEHDSQQVRCKRCQKCYRKLYKTSWWRGKPASAHKYYQFYKFALTLTDIELIALVSKKRIDMKTKGCDYQTLRSHIKILQAVYDFRNDERADRILEEYRKEGERIEEVAKGVDHETYG